MRALALLACLCVGCGAPGGRGDGEGETATEGGEDDTTEETDAHDFVGGTWAPRASLARVEDIPRGGRVEERPSRTGAVRLIALMPVDGTGNHIVEIVGLPALDPNVVVASLRAAHGQPLWVGCSELAFVADGAAQTVDGCRHEGGVTPLGVHEAIQGRIPVSRLETAGAATALVVESCENEYTVQDGPALLREFVSRFGELTVAQADMDTTPSEPPVETETGTEEPAPATEVR